MPSMSNQGSPFFLWDYYLVLAQFIPRVHYGLIIQEFSNLEVWHNCCKSSSELENNYVNSLMESCQILSHMYHTSLISTKLLCSFRFWQNTGQKCHVHSLGSHDNDDISSTKKFNKVWYFKT